MYCNVSVRIVSVYSLAVFFMFVIPVSVLNKYHSARFDCEQWTCAVACL